MSGTWEVDSTVSGVLMVRNVVARWAICAAFVCEVVLEAVDAFGLVQPVKWRLCKYTIPLHVFCMVKF